MPRRVGSRHAQYHDKCSIIRTGEVVPYQSACFVTRLEKGEHERSSYVRQQPQKDEDAPRLLAVAGDIVVQEDAGQDRDGDYEAVWDLQEGGGKAGEAEALDDEGAEVADSALERNVSNVCSYRDRRAYVGDVANNTEDEEKIGFVVGENLFQLVCLEVLVLYSRLCESVRRCTNEGDLGRNSRFSLSLSTAILRSLTVRPLADKGESGRKMNMTIPQQQQSAPMMMNSYFHDGSAPLMEPMP